MEGTSQVDAVEAWLGSGGHALAEHIEASGGSIIVGAAAADESYSVWIDTIRIFKVGVIHKPFITGTIVG